MRTSTLGLVFGNMRLWFAGDIWRHIINYVQVKSFSVLRFNNMSYLEVFLPLKKYGYAPERVDLLVIELIGDDESTGYLQRAKESS